MTKQEWALVLDNNELAGDCKWWRKRSEGLESERDELLDALQQLVDAIDSQHVEREQTDGYIAEFVDSYRVAISTIEKATGGEA